MSTTTPTTTPAALSPAASTPAASAPKRSAITLDLTLNTIAAALLCDPQVHVLVAGQNCAGVALAGAQAAGGG